MEQIQDINSQQANIFNLIKWSSNSRHLHSQGNEPFGTRRCGSELPTPGQETPASRFKCLSLFIFLKKAILKTWSDYWQVSLLVVKCYMSSSSSTCCSITAELASEQIRVGRTLFKYSPFYCKGCLAFMFQLVQCVPLWLILGENLTILTMWISLLG